MKWLDRFLAPWRYHDAMRSDIQRLGNIVDGQGVKLGILDGRYQRFLRLAPEPDSPTKRAESNKIAEREIARLLAEEAARRHTEGKDV